MDHGTFDRFAIDLATGKTRRAAVRLAIAASVGALAQRATVARAFPTCANCQKACDRCEACIEAGGDEGICLTCPVCHYCAADLPCLLR